MGNCVACGRKAQGKRLELDFCRVCRINFDDRLKKIRTSTNIKDLDDNYLKVVNIIETKDNYNDINKQKVINYFKKVYDLQKDKLLRSKKQNDKLIYMVTGNRGRSLEVYHNKIVITVKVTPGSYLTKNMTDGKKTIYYTDVIGLQFKTSATLIGYLQLETASSIMNNLESNFFNENTFTFDETTTNNILMEEIEKYIDKRLEEIKYSNNAISPADEIKKFKSLLDDNIITQEEFDKKKKDLLEL